MLLEEQLPHLLGNGLLPDLFMLALAAFCGICGHDVWRDWRRERTKKPASFTITICDEDGIPVKQHRSTGKSAADLITRINAGWFD